MKPTPRGGLSDPTRVEVRFDGNGLYKFACALDEARERAIYMKRQSAEEEEGLRKSRPFLVRRALILAAVRARREADRVRVVGVCMHAAAYSTPGPSGASTPYAPGDIPDENPPGYDD